MAGPLLNFTIFMKSFPHALRAVSLATFPPAFLILLIQGIASQQVNPAIGILPLFFSAAFSALLLVNEKRCGCQASGLTGTPIHLVFDLMLGIGLLVCLILDWVLMPKSSSWSRHDRGDNKGLVMLGTYGTNFLIVNFLTHLYFVGKQLQESLSPGSSYPMSCPQCQDKSFSVGKIRLGGATQGIRDGYAPLLDGEGEPRASAEGGAATEDGEMV
ncbi:hypothetical protein DE146DRAFT_728829 [Phaeosphaeria sp. MPI-PUGE-AT-0046c]|nr:hypothetical protein DE146DRAFT_728829 [Phaeosphaeria sp. MPI-PUGE-AT-0046c]